MQTMYAGKVNSPATTLDGGINDSVTTINIINGAVLPSAPNIAVIGTGEDAETILYATKVGNQLSNITRGFQGVAKEWSTGEVIARLFTEYDYGALKGNVGTLAGRKITDFGEVSSAELAGKITDEIGSGKLFFGTEGEWTPSLKFGGNSINMDYAIKKGLYTKIGRQVTLTADIILSAKGTSIGAAVIGGLPFTSKNVDGADTSVSLLLDKVSFANVWTAQIVKNGAYIHLYEITEGGVLTTLTNDDFENTSAIKVSATYFID